jgi:hypothetical protein
MATVSDPLMPMTSNSDEPGVRAIVLVILALWFVIVLAAGSVGIFESRADQRPLAILLAIAAPLLLFGAAYRGSSRFRDWALSIDLRWLTAIQAWRVIGGAFLVLYAFDLLPGTFAWPAGAGDIAVGLAAPFVLMAILRQAQDWRSQVLWLNVAGLLDFAGAIITGMLSSNSALGIFFESSNHVSLGALPLSLIPTFAVPLWTIFHILSFAQLRQVGQGTRLARASATTPSPSSQSGPLAGCQPLQPF